MKNIMYLILVSCTIFISCTTDEVLSKDDTPVVTTPIPTTSADTSAIVLKKGIFNGSSGYPANGTAQLIKNKSEEYSVVLEKDFSTTFATGAVTMYLSKTPIPNFKDSSSFINLAVINKNGYHQFALKNKPSDALNNVVVWCQPAGVKFGHAELK